MKCLEFLVVFCAALLPVGTCAFSSKDSLVLKNKDIIVGEIKQMDKGVLTIETDYSKKDFQVEWYGIAELYTKSKFLITLRDGRRLTGNVQSLPGTGRLLIQMADSQQAVVTFRELVFLKELQSGFWDRMKASIDFGLSFTKANNLRQMSTRSSLGYLSTRWQLDAYYNANRSVQDSIADIRRTEAGISYRIFLPKDWYGQGSVNLLSNTEQALRLRTTSKAGVGKMVLHTNRKYWGVGMGLSFLHETFTNATPTRNSIEAYAGSEISLFDLENLNLFNTVFLYKGITEGERWRCDVKLDLKYDLPKDFYLKPGLTLNYDNRPAIAGRELDYVFVLNIGWEL
jgi:putative salt-induced outer membrane protein YdiY